MTKVNSYIHGNIFNVSIENLTPDSNQARKFFSPEAHDEMCRSISAVGLIQPITVTLVDGKLIIVAGERRWRAAKDVGLESVQVKFVDHNISEISIIENLQRENLLPVEKAEGLQRLKEQHNYSHEQLAGIIGKSVSTISEILTLNRLPDDIKAECSTSKRYVHSRLLEIAKSPNLRTLRKRFAAYKAELYGTVRKPGLMDKSKKLEGLICRISGIITQISNIELEPLTLQERTNLFFKLDDLKTVTHNKFSFYSELEASDSRSSHSVSRAIVPETVAESKSGFSPQDGSISEASAFCNDQVAYGDESIAACGLANAETGEVLDNLGAVSAEEAI